MTMEAYQAGSPTPNGMLRSIQHWTNRTIPFQITKHKPISSLTEQYLLLLVVFKLIWPQATYIECIAFIANKPNNAKLFLEKDESIALRKLGYTMLSGTCRVQFEFLSSLLDLALAAWDSQDTKESLNDGDEFGLHLNSTINQSGL
jgi:hypothetical protein